MRPLTISPIHAFSDNYIWMLSNGSSAFVVDPGDADPVLETLSQLQLKLSGILITHHHFDHTGGLAALQSATGCKTWGPVDSPAGGYDHLLREGDTVDVMGVEFSVLEVPGHTLDHIAFYSEAEQAVFCGDTLFVGGCGRVFEGDPPQMRRSLQKLRSLPPKTRVFCAHEYTLTNLRFARQVEPDNQQLENFLLECEEKRRNNIATVPSILGGECEYNPFLRWDSPAVRDNLRLLGRLSDDNEDAVFTAVREWKNQA
jgi:hydroxyacylglutathione hydrolase